MLIGLCGNSFCMTLNNTRLTDVKLVKAITEKIPLLPLYNKCLKREYVIELLVGTNLVLSVNIPKLGVWKTISCHVLAYIFITAINLNTEGQ